MFAPLVTVAALVLVFPGTYGQQQTLCTPQNRAANLNRCLAAIRFRAHDKVNSPYGEAYFNRCPPGERFNMNCFEPDRITEPKSIAELTFRVDNPDLSTIDRFMFIQYISPAGSYTGCDHTYSYPNEKRFFVDPLANIAYPAWDLREHPFITWDYTDGDIFTIIVVDPNWTTKSVVVNIQGNDFDSELSLYDYDGIRNFRNSPRAAAFILYRQTRELFVERIPSAGFNVTDFAERNQLQGPLAFSWVNAQYDAYGVGGYPYGENCASLVQDALLPLLPALDFLPGPEEIDLKVFLHVQHTVSALSYDCGIYSITPPAHEVIFDPIDPQAFFVNTDDLRPSMLDTMTLTMNKLNPHPSDFDGKLHTIIMLRSDRVLYSMIVNVEGDTVTSQVDDDSSGFHLVSYLVPNPDVDHRFFLTLLYEQTARIPTTTDMTSYLSCTGTRQFTNMARFLSDHQMTLVGVSRMMVTPDEYSTCGRPNA